jgi:hypothetical protein
MAATFAWFIMYDKLCEPYEQKDSLLDAELFSILNMPTLQDELKEIETELESLKRRFPKFFILESTLLKSESIR